MKRNGNNRAMVASKTRIPEGWRLVRLGDVAEVAFSGVDKRTVEGEFPVELCNYTDVFYNRRIQASMDFMPATATQSELKRWALKQGDVLFTKDSETADEIGIPAFVADDLTDVLCGYHLGLARPSQATVNGSFLARTLASRTSAQEFGRIANGVTRFGLTLDATRNLPILLPPLPEQRAIAAVLDSIDDAIECTDAVIAATEQLRDSLLHQLLTRGVPGWHTAWKEVPGLGTMPADWDVVSLGEVIGSTTYGTNIQLGRDGAVAVLRMNNLQGGELDLRDVRRADLSEKESNDLSLVPGDILFNRTNSRDLVGKVAIVRDLEQPVSFASYLIRLRAAKTRANPYWLVALLGSSQCQDRIRKFATPGVSQANINPTNLKSLTISLPSLAEQQTVARVLDGADATLVRVRQERARLQRVKDSTADALLTGLVKAIR